jgi:hypothetical protein
MNVMNKNKNLIIKKKKIKKLKKAIIFWKIYMPKLFLKILGVILIKFYLYR